MIENAKFTPNLLQLDRKAGPLLLLLLLPYIPSSLPTKLLFIVLIRVGGGGYQYFPPLKLPPCAYNISTPHGCYRQQNRFKWILWIWSNNDFSSFSLSFCYLERDLWNDDIKPCLYPPLHKFSVWEAAGKFPRFLSISKWRELYPTSWIEPQLFNISSSC